jgi:hypothetical protein
MIVHEILSNIQSNEALYENLDVQIKYDYQVDPGSKENDDMVIKKRDLFQRSVKQGTFFFTEIRQEDVSVKGKTGSYKAITGYDGKKTISLISSAETANVHQERREPLFLYRPHNWIFAPSEGVMVPLSTYLRGGAQFRNHPSAGIYKHCDVSTAFEKSEEFHGLSCLKLRCNIWKFDESKKGVLGMYFFLWVAPERNYLPVKSEAFEQREGKLLAFPSAVAIAETFRRIKPGLWLPNRQKLTVYDQWESKPGKMVVDNTTTIQLEKVVLDPKYPISFFKDIPFPKGTQVIEIKAGEPNKSYIVGRPANEERDATEGSGWTYFVLLSCLIFALLGALMIYRHRISKSGQQN